MHQRLITDQRSAHQACTDLYGITKANPGRYLLRLVTVDPSWRQQLRAAFHGHVLRDIAEQARVPQPDGTLARYSKAAWKTLLKDWFAGGESTEAMDDFEFAEFVLQCSAFAAMDLGVEFSVEDDR